MIIAIVLICIFLIVAKNSLKSLDKEKPFNHANRLRSNPIFRNRRKR